MGSKDRDDYVSINSNQTDLQSTLDPAFNQQIASETLELLEQEVPGLNVVGGYLTGSSAYGLAINQDAVANVVNNEDKYEGSDIDLYVIVREGEEENKDFISDSYDLIDNIDEHIDYMPAEINPMVIREGKFLGALKQAGEDWEDSADTEYIELPAPTGKDRHEYPEFIESLKERILLGSIQSSPAEKELLKGEKRVEPYFENNGSKVKQYMQSQYTQRDEILAENLAKGLFERAKHNSDEIVGALGQVRHKTSLKNILETSFDISDVEQITRGSFGNFEIEIDSFEDNEQTKLSDYGVQEYPDQEVVRVNEFGITTYFAPSSDELEYRDILVNEILGAHEDVDVISTTKGFEYPIKGQLPEGDFDSQELLRDMVESIAGKALSEIEIDFNPRELEFDELAEIVEKRTPEDQSTIQEW